jgi:hypothetical protein
MKLRLLAMLCVLVLSGAAFAQGSASKSSAALSENGSQRRHHRSLETRAGASRLLPTGTAIRIRLKRPLSTRGNRVGDKFYSQITDPIRVNDRILVPAGSTVTGFIDRVAQPHRFAGHPSLRLRPDKMTLPDGESYAIDAAVVDSGNPRRVKVNEEGRISGLMVSTDEKVETVALTSTGAVAGAVVAGPPGLLMGAAAGATASAGHYLIKRHAMELPAGTILILELNAPLHLATSEAVSHHHVHPVAAERVGAE